MLFMKSNADFTKSGFAVHMYYRDRELNRMFLFSFREEK